MQDLTIQEAYSWAYYNIREKLWRTLINLCKEGEKRFSDPFFVFWRAYGLYREGNPGQAVTELQKIESKKELQWATIRASIFYHRKCKTVDYATVDSLTYMERDFQKNPTERAVVALAYFEMFNGEFDSARQILQHTHFDSPQTLVAKGWLEVYTQEEEKAEIGKRYFEDALKVDQRNVEAYFGLARLGEKVKKASVVQNAVNDILELNSDFVPALIDKCRLGVLKRDFAVIKEGCQELLRLDKNNILGFIYNVFYLLAEEGKLDEAREKYEKLSQLLLSQESENIDLLLFVARLFSRLCGRATVILSISYRLLDQCRKLDNMSVEVLLEIGNTEYMLEEYSHALRSFKTAASLNTEVSDLAPMLGLILTQIAMNQLEEAELQLKFISEVVDSDGGKTAEFCLVEAMLLARRKLRSKDISNLEANLQEANRALDDAIKLHLAQQKKVSQNLQYYLVLNPDFLLTLANEMLYHSDFNLGQIMDKVQNPITPTHLIKKCAKLIETTLNKIPGLIPGYLLSAKAHMIVGNTNAAIQNLQKAIALDPKNEEAYIMNAIVVYSNGNSQAAYSSIKEALANNFEIDKNPFFMMLRGKLELEIGDSAQGLKTLEKAYNLPGIQTAGFEQKKKSRYMTIVSFNQNIRSQVYVEYAKALAQEKQLAKSKEIMEQAIMEFAGTEDEPVVLLGNADIAAIGGDLKKAITILRAVEPEAKGYMEARKKLASIYLNKMMNRRQYAKCFADLVQVYPNFENYKIYGDALLDIQEPDKAIEAYEEALQIDPTNQHIVRAIGKALSITHNYQRAIEYYEEAVQKHPKNLDLKLDQAKLLVKNNFFEKAEEILDKDSLLKDPEEQNLETVKRQVEGLVELAKIYRKKINSAVNVDDQAVTNLQQIWAKILSLQLDAIERAKYEGGRPEDEKRDYSNYCEEAGRLRVETESTWEKAKECYEEALRICPNRAEIGLELGEIDMWAGEPQEAETKALRLLKAMPTNHEAMRLLHDALLSQGLIDKGLDAFKRITQRDPSNFVALAGLLDFLRRDGQLDQVKEQLSLLDARLGKSNEPGYCFIKGLYFYFRKNPNEALINLFQAKRHHLYKNAAIKIMIDIYLNPDQDLLFNSATEKLKPFKQENLECMEALLGDITDKYYSIEQQVYSCYASVLLRKEYKESEEYLQQIITQRENMVPALIALCVCKIAKGGKNALDKNSLKSISKAKFNAKWGEDSERGWLQVADFLISVDKVDLAERELERCLKYNKSSAKALELLGSVAEKKGDFNGALDMFNKSWSVSEQKDCALGYRIAGLYFKYKDYANALIIARKVLAVNPNYPKIKEEILDKARDFMKP